MLQVSPQSVAIWPITGDVPELQTIIADQAETIAANEVLLHDYQVNLNAAQNPVGPAATANGQTSGTSNQLIVSVPVTGTIVAGATITWTGMPTAPPVTILGQISGNPGQDGTWLISAPITLAAITALTFTPPPATGAWPTPTDAPTLLLITQQQTAILRNQSALLQHYVDLLNTSQTPAPPTGP